jgi:hypothetical protein
MDPSKGLVILWLPISFFFSFRKATLGDGLTVTRSSWSWIRPVNARAGYRQGKATHPGACLWSSVRHPKDEKPPRPRPILCGAVPPIILKIRALCSWTWVREPQKRHRKQKRQHRSGHGRPAFPLGLSLPPLQRQRATPYNASAPAFSYLRAAGRGRALVWMRCRWVLAGRHDKRRPGRGRKEAAARGKAILLAKAEAGSGQWQCMHV